MGFSFFSAVLGLWPAPSPDPVTDICTVESQPFGLSLVPIPECSQQPQSSCRWACGDFALWGGVRILFLWRGYGSLSSPPLCSVLSQISSHCMALQTGTRMSEWMDSGFWDTKAQDQVLRMAPPEVTHHLAGIAAMGPEYQHLPTLHLFGGRL